MQSQDMLFPMADSQGRLECKEIWGGIQNKDVEISAGNVNGSIYSAPCCRGGKDRSKAFALNIPLAVEQDAHYEEVTISIAPGDRQFVYTDGIIDTPNPAGKRFGMTRLKQVLDENASAPLPDIKSAVINSLNQYADTGELDTSGLLGITRHPWYLAAFLIIWAREMDVSLVVCAKAHARAKLWNPDEPAELSFPVQLKYWLAC